MIGYESIMKDGAAVGYVTSGAYGHCVGKSLAAGYVPTALARDGARFEIDILGEMRTATVQARAAPRSAGSAAARLTRQRGIESRHGNSDQPAPAGRSAAASPRSAGKSSVSNVGDAAIPRLRGVIAAIATPVGDAGRITRG